MTQPHDEFSEAPTADNMFDADGALSREFLLRRGYCCTLGCKNCPYAAVSRDTAELMDS